IAAPARLQCEGAVLPLGHELEDSVPFVTSNFSVLIRVLVVEKALEGLLGLVSGQGSIPVLVEVLEHGVERRHLHLFVFRATGASAREEQRAIGRYWRGTASRGHSVQKPLLRATLQIVPDHSCVPG